MVILLKFQNGWFWTHHSKATKLVWNQFRFLKELNKAYTVTNLKENLEMLNTILYKHTFGLFFWFYVYSFAKLFLPAGYSLFRSIFIAYNNLDSKIVANLI